MAIFGWKFTSRKSEHINGLDNLGTNSLKTSRLSNSVFDATHDTKVIGTIRFYDVFRLPTVLLIECQFTPCTISVFTSTHQTLVAFLI